MTEADNFPSHASPVESSPDRVESTSTDLLPRFPLQRWLTPTLIAAMTLVPLACWWFQREVSWWYAAAASEATLNDDLVGSIDLRRKAVAWNPTDYYLRDRLINDLLHQRLIDEAIREADVSLRIARSNFADTSRPTARDELSTALNQAAYARSVAKRDLAEARKLIDECITLWPSVEEVPGGILDTRGYIAYLQNEIDMALLDLERAVENYEPYVKRLREQLRQDEPLTLDSRGLRWQMRSLDEGLAVVLRHRALVYERLGRKDDADRDFARVKELGFDPHDDLW